jgi:hypothetical protein
MARPDQPLVLFLGSSRFLFGVRPDLLASGREAGDMQPVVFNFGEARAGPVSHLVYLNRLVHRGIRVSHLFVEVWPCHLTTGCHGVELNQIAGRPVHWCDLPLLWRHTETPRELVSRCFQDHMAPSHAYRQALLGRCAMDWLLSQQAQHAALDVDALGWHAEPAAPAGPEKAYRMQRGFRPAFESGFRKWTFSAMEDQALRQIIALCRRHRIGLTLVYMPEGPEFQSWCPAAIRRQVDVYLDRLSQETEVPWINARDWMPESAFVDSFHLSCDGAQAFTERFGREVLQPLLQRQSSELATVFTDRARSAP